MSDLISRQAAIDALNEQIEQCNKALGSFDISLKDEFAIKVERASLKAYKEQLENLPTVQPTITHEQAIDYLHETGWLQNHDRILTEHEQMYKRAFSVACELLIGAYLFGVTEETMFREIMEKDGIVSSLGYERYILDNLARLTGED